MSCGERPGVLLNIPECSEQPPQQRTVWLPMSVVLRLRNPEMNQEILRAPGQEQDPEQEGPPGREGPGQPRPPSPFLYLEGTLLCRVSSRGIV